MARTAGWFPTCVGLQDGVHHCLDLLVRLTRRSGLGTLFSSKWAYELPFLLWKDRTQGPYTPLFGNLNGARMFT